MKTILINKKSKTYVVNTEGVIFNKDYEPKIFLKGEALRKFLRWIKGCGYKEIKR